MKIAIAGFTEFPGGGAVPHRIYMMAKGLVGLGHQIFVAVPLKNSSGPLQYSFDGINVIAGGYLKTNGSTSFSTKIYKRISLFKAVHQLSAQKLDWLFLYDMGMDSLPYLMIAHKNNWHIAAENCDVRLVTYNRLKDKLIQHSYQLAYTILSSKFDLNLSVSTFLKTHCEKIAPDVPSLIIPAIIDTDTFKMDANVGESFRKQWGLDQDLIISYLGSLEKIHGIEILLSSAMQLKEAGKEFKLVVCGRIVNDLRKHEIMELVNKLNLKDHILFTGFLPTQEVLAAMSAADILVAPQIDHIANQAGFPQKIAEYLSLGKPIVSSATGDIPRYLKHGDNALLSRPGDADSLFKALTTLIDHPGLRLRLAQRARQSARQFFDCRTIARQIEDKLFEINNLPRRPLTPVRTTQS